MDDKIKTPVVDVTPTTTTPVEENKGGTQKSFTQDDMNKLAGDVRREEKEKNEKAIQEAVNTAIAEYERKSQLSAEEKEKEARSKREKEIAEREQKIALREMRIEAKDMLSEKQIPTELVDFIVDIDANKTKENIDKLFKVYSKSVETGVTEKLKGTPPKDFSNDNHADDKKKTISSAF